MTKTERARWLISNVFRECYSVTREEVVRTEIKSHWAWTLWPVIPGKLQQEDQKFEASIVLVHDELMSLKPTRGGIIVLK